MNGQTSGMTTMSVMDQVASLVRAARDSGYLPPAREARASDIVLGTASDHVKAIRTARERLKDELKPTAEAVRRIEDEIRAMIPKGVHTNSALRVWLETSVEGKAKHLEGELLNRSTMPKLALIKVMSVLLTEEVRATFPETVERLDGKVPRINNNWDVVAADAKASIGDLFRSLVGDNVSVVAISI